MKIMSRNFTRGEKIILVILAVILVGLVYYWFVDQPVRESIANSKAESASIQAELDAVQAEVLRMEIMQSELDDLEGSGRISWMGSYNNSEEELRILNDVLSETIQYTINFSNVTRNGDQIRRNFSLQFKTVDYDAASAIIEKLEKGEYRCIIGDTRCDVSSDGSVTVNANATFYETMVGGTPDAGLPASSAAAE